MARQDNKALPKSSAKTLSKLTLLDRLTSIDRSEECRKRILNMENNFRRKIDAHIASRLQNNAKFKTFKTNPYVLLIHAKQRGYSKVSDLESDLLPAKQFSSMETSVGKMVEEVVLPVYGWECVASKMHTKNSTLDGKNLDGDTLRLVTLKSGPSCLNDSISKQMADDILNNYQEWANDAGVSKIDFSYGVLYGTQKTSNKKDWHILKNIDKKRPDIMTVTPEHRWNCQFVDNNITVNVTVRVGLDWWEHLGGELCFMEIFSALIRACIIPGEMDATDYEYTLSDINSIVSTASIPKDYNVSILQRSQIPWLFLMAKHFCDRIIDAP